MPQTVKGVIARRAGEPVELVDIVVPDPGPGEAVVWIAACGVCHTDLHYREGGINDEYPFLLGHEAAGVVSAVKKDSWLDYIANVLALSGISTPNFWLGIMLILLFAVHLGWLPASGYVSPFEDWRQSLATTIMPAFVLGNSIAGVIMRHTRGAMLQALQSDYVRTARAKGLSGRAVVLKHAMRNALTPVITLGALEFGTLLSGAVLTEQIFTIPGFGKLIVDAVFNRDYAVVQGVVLCTAVAFILMNLIADVLYVVLNPRMRSTL